MDIAKLILSLPFKTRNADEFMDENILNLFVDPTDGVAGPFDYKNEIIKGKMGTGKTMYLRANYIYHLSILVPQMIDRGSLILPLYIKLSDFQNLHNPEKIYDQIIIRLIQEILNTCDKLRSANELVNLHNGFRNNVVGMWFNRVSQNSIVEKLNEITAEEYTQQVTTELNTKGTIGHSFLTACGEYGRTSFIGLKKNTSPQISDVVFAYEKLLRPIDCKLLVLFDEVSSVDKSFFEECGGASFFETLMNQLRTLDFIRTKIAVYPHTFADVLTETRYGDVIILEDDINDSDGYNVFLNKTISILNPYYEKASTVIDRYKDNLALLEDIYLKYLDLHGDEDQDGEFLAELFCRDPDFLYCYLDKALDHMGTSFYAHNSWASRLHFVWDNETFQSYPELISDYLFEKTGEEEWRYSAIISQLLLCKNEDSDIVAKRQNAWILHTIEMHAAEPTRMHYLFGAISESSADRRRIALEKFLKLNDDYALFEKLPLESPSIGGIGSMIPYIQARIDYFLSLKPLLTGVKFLKHRQRIEQRIAYWTKQIKDEEIQELLDNLG